jgi:hypothetical protein
MVIWSLAVDVTSALVESPQTNDPVVVALARFPAAKEEEPEAVLLDPPGTVAELPDPTFPLPPPTVADAPLPVFDGNYAVLGSWIAAGVPAGLSVREDAGPITRNRSRFLPHAIIR